MLVIVYKKVSSFFDCAQSQQDCKLACLFTWCCWTFTNASKTKLIQKWNNSKDKRKSKYIFCAGNFYMSLEPPPLFNFKMPKIKPIAKLVNSNFTHSILTKTTNNESLHIECLLLLRTCHFCIYSITFCVD